MEYGWEQAVLTGGLLVVLVTGGFRLRVLTADQRLAWGQWVLLGLPWGLWLGLVVWGIRVNVTVIIWLLLATQLGYVTLGWWRRRLLPTPALSATAAVSPESEVAPFLSLPELRELFGCRTAIGDTYAELGFAGLAVRLGAKRAVASLWYVEDEGTLALMNDFYRRLQTSATVPIASDALRQAQINMIRGNIRFQDRRLMGPGYTIALPPTLRQGERSLSHPYFWAGFNMIGNPW